MKRILIIAAATGLFLGACTETTTTTQASSVDPITAAVSGKTLTLGDNIRFVNDNNGRVTGNVGDEEYVGTWTVRNGMICNQFSKPARFSDPRCLETTLNNDGTITIGSRSGGSNTFNIE